MINLPELILFNDYPCYKDYIDTLYSFFKNDFLDNQVCYLDLVIVCFREPLEDNKEASFWHVITSDSAGPDRPLDTKRSERIRWPKPIIEGFEDESIKVWEGIKKDKKRKKQKRIYFCFGDWEYLVILSRRKGYLWLCTAYPIFENGYKRKLETEYKNYCKKQTPPY